ncbi:MAG: 50S ribosomal protein L25 [bacterium]|nr:50S ribosomal protein L25 [bacterium]
MSHEDIVIELQKREQLGKGLNHLRAEGKIPGVVHNRGKESVHVVGSEKDLEEAFSKAGHTQPITVTVEGKDYFTIIKDVDEDPIKQNMRHIVFNTIRSDVKTTAEVPIHVEGDPPAGLIMVQNLETVEVSALPKEMPESLSVSIESLAEDGDKIHVRDIQTPAGVEIVTDADTAVAGVEEPRAAIEQEEADEAAAAAEAEAEEGAEAAEASASEDKSSEGEPKKEDSKE